MSIDWERIEVGKYVVMKVSIIVQKHTIQMYKGTMSRRACYDL